MAFRGHIIVIRPSTWTQRHSSLFHSRTHSQGCTTTTQQCRSAQTDPPKCVFLSLPAHTITIIYQETIKKYKFIRKLQRIRYVSALALPQENSQDESETKCTNTIPHSTITIIMISPSIAINNILLGCCLFTIIKPSFPYTLLAGSPSIFGGLSSSLGEGNGASHRNALPGLTWLAGSNQSSSRRRDDYHGEEDRPGHQ